MSLAAECALNISVKTSVADWQDEAQNQAPRIPLCLPPKMSVMSKGGEEDDEAQRVTVSENLDAQDSSQDDMSCSQSDELGAGMQFAKMLEGGRRVWGVGLRA